MYEENLTGQCIMGYTLCEKLGSGASGTVYMGSKTNAAGQFIRAVKHITFPSESQYYSVINSMGGDIKKAENYFSQQLDILVSEIKILSKLSEEDARHIVRYYENEIDSSRFPRRCDIYILMEYLTPLNTWIRNHPFRVSDAIRLGLDILEGIKLCHDHGVIHRDIKEDNIFVSERGTYKLGDFGVSKMLDQNSGAETLTGTLSYIAPEIYHGREKYNHTVDLYSLGMVLYKLLNHERIPFLPEFPRQFNWDDENLAFSRRMSGEIPPCPDMGGDAIGQVILKAVSGSTERFQTAEDFAEALKSAAENTPQEFLDEEIIIYSSPAPIEVSGTDRLNAVNEDDPSTFAVRKPPVHPESTGSSTMTDSIRPDAYPEILPQGDSVLQKSRGQNYLLFLPVLIVLAGAVFFFAALPAVLGKSIPLGEWLFKDSAGILNEIRSAGRQGFLTPKVTGIAVLKVFLYFWILDIICGISYTVYRLFRSE